MYCIVQPGIIQKTTCQDRFKICQESPNTVSLIDEQEDSDSEEEEEEERTGHAGQDDLKAELDREYE